MAKQEQSNPRLVLLPAPFQGHLTPMLQLGTALKSRGFSITIVHPQFSSTDCSAHLDFDFICLNDGMSESDSRSGNLIRLLLKLNASCEASFQEGQNNYLDKGGPGQDVVGLDVPRVSLITNSAAASLALVPLLKAQGLIPLPDSIKQDKVPEPSPQVQRSAGDFDDLLWLIHLAGNIRTSLAIIVNSIKFLEESPLNQFEEYSVPIFSIGPLHKVGRETSTSLMAEDESCMSWLDK